MTLLPPLTALFFFIKTIFILTLVGFEPTTADKLFKALNILPFELQDQKICGLNLNLYELP